jgi:hypothetical protein
MEYNPLGYIRQWENELFFKGRLGPTSPTESIK